MAVSLKDVGVDMVTDLAPETLPVNGPACERTLLCHLGLQPALQAGVVDVFYATTAFADREKRVHDRARSVPAKATEDLVFFLNNRHGSWLFLSFNIGWCCLRLIIIGLNLRSSSSILSFFDDSRSVGCDQVGWLTIGSNFRLLFWFRSVKWHAIDLNVVILTSYLLFLRVE